MSKGHTTGSDLPWSFPVMVSQLPEAGLHQALEASAAQRDLIAKAAGVNAVLRATASFDVVAETEGRVSVTGKVVDGSLFSFIDSDLVGGIVKRVKIKNLNTESPLSLPFGVFAETRIDRVDIREPGERSQRLSAGDSIDDFVVELI